MKSRSIYRATRLIISALAASDLSARQLQEFAEFLMADSETRDELAQLISSLASRLREYEPAGESPNRERGDVESQILAVIRHRRLSKSEILIALRRISPVASDWFIALPRMPMSEAIRLMRERYSDQLLVELLEALLPGSAGQDEYLKGIMRR